jgi:hypothetical protein
MTLSDHLASVDVDGWQRLYTCAIAEGNSAKNAAIVYGAERPDEILAETLPGFVRLGALAGGSIDARLDGCVEPSLAAESAALLWLFDRTLAAHGRAYDYDVSAWREEAVTNAYAVAGHVGGGDPERFMLDGAVGSANSAVDILVALRRDLLGVPEALAETIGQLLCVYAATTRLTE